MQKQKISREIVAFEFTAPLKVIKTKTKDFILNLNNYRNAHYQVLNKTKVEFCTLMDAKYSEEYEPAPGEVKTTYTVYSGSKRKFDLPNVCSIVQKYFEDWMTHKGIIPTDDITVITECEYSFGGTDKDNPRVDITVEWEKE
jgi:hypothetical protein